MTTENPNDPWLDPMHSIGYLTRINFRVFSRALEQRTAKYGVSSGQWRLLRVLWEEDNITQRELSRRTGTREATTVHAVRSLIAAGLARRSRSATDRRKVHIRLTPRAQRLAAKLMPIAVAVNEMALDGIAPEDVATTRRVLAQTYDNLRAQMDPTDV